MKPESSMSHSQRLFSNPYHEPNQSNFMIDIYFSNNNNNNNNNVPLAY